MLSKDLECFLFKDKAKLTDFSFPEKRNASYIFHEWGKRRNSMFTLL